MKKKRKRKIREYQIITEIPETLIPETIYIEGEKRNHWIASLLCPCGCNEVIRLNLLKNVYPRWNIKFHWYGKISLSPSIKRTVGCNSHFVINKNKIYWCNF